MERQAEGDRGGGGGEVCTEGRQMKSCHPASATKLSRCRFLFPTLFLLDLQYLPGNNRYGALLIHTSFNEAGLTQGQHQSNGRVRKKRQCFQL